MSCSWAQLSLCRTAHLYQFPVSQEPGPAQQQREGRADAECDDQREPGLQWPWVGGAEESGIKGMEAMKSPVLHVTIENTI